MLFDPVVKGGILYEKLRYQYRKKKANKRRFVQLSDDEEEEEISEEELDVKVSELVEYFGTVLLPRDKPQLLVKLKESARIRLIALRKNKRDVFESSKKLYLVDPGLVIWFHYFFITLNFFLSQSILITGFNRF